MAASVSMETSIPPSLPITAIVILRQYTLLSNCLTRSCYIASEASCELGALMPVL